MMVHARSCLIPGVKNVDERTAIEKFIEEFPQWAPFKTDLRTHFGRHYDTISYEGLVVGTVGVTNDEIKMEAQPPDGN